MISIWQDKTKYKNTRKTYIFVGDISLDQGSIEARLHIMQFFIVLKESTMNNPFFKL